MANRTFSRVAKWSAALAASGALVLGVAGGAMSAGATSAARPAVTVASVKIQNYLYMPKALHITPGTKVTWTNKDFTGHTVTFKTFGSPTLGTGRTYSHTFATVGTFKYHCTLHPDMIGKVVVAAG
jgi:plastocyanin